MKKHMTLTFLGIVLPHFVLVYCQDPPDSKPCGKSILLLDRALISAFGLLHYAFNIKKYLFETDLPASNQITDKMPSGFFFI